MRAFTGPEQRPLLATENTQPLPLTVSRSNFPHFFTRPYFLFQIYLDVSSMSAQWLAFLIIFNFILYLHRASMFNYVCLISRFYFPSPFSALHFAAYFFIVGFFFSYFYSISALRLRCTHSMSFLFKLCRI